ncbi:MAG: septum formation initiator family protein [Candidatus Omnitrophota bacterium]|nr:septum formation initiator family protein [Candidatus Omnitrophota bacterium]MBU1894336.1 septum formation initiator family protein [Candidatus Omnitrophota bacterium]
MERKKIIFYIFGTLTVLCIIFLPGYSKLQRLREENLEKIQRIKLLKENNRKVSAELTKMKEDPEYVERKAREKLGIVKKGEVIYRKKENS